MHIVVHKSQLKLEHQTYTPEEIMIHINSIEKTASYEAQIKKEAKKQQQRYGIQTKSTTVTNSMENQVAKNPLNLVIKLLHQIYPYRFYIVSLAIASLILLAKPYHH